MSEGTARGLFTVDNFRGNGTLTILYPTPEWLESQEIIDVLELFRSLEVNITVEPQPSHGRWDITPLLFFFTSFVLNLPLIFGGLSMIKE